MSNLAEEMKAHALEAQKFSRKHLVLELDFSEASMQELDTNCDTVEFAIRGGKSPENIEMLVRVWGAYVGEALRRASSAEWVENEASASRCALRGPSGEIVSPHDHVRKRLGDKKAESLPEYFRAARAKLRGEAS